MTDIPEYITVGARHGNVGRPDAYAAIVIHCDMCQWEIEYPCQELRELILDAEEHITNACQPRA